MQAKLTICRCPRDRSVWAAMVEGAGGGQMLTSTKCEAPWLVVQVLDITSAALREAAEYAEEIEQS